MGSRERKSRPAGGSLAFTLLGLGSDGVNVAQVDMLRKAVEKEGATLALIAAKAGGVKTRRGELLPADHALSAAPSIFFDAVAMLPSEEGAARLVQEAAAIDWLRDAFGHLKVIGHVASAAPLFEKAAIAIDADEGVVSLEGRAGVAAFIAAAKLHRIWAREPSLRSPG